MAVNSKKASAFGYIYGAPEFWNLLMKPEWVLKSLNMFCVYLREELLSCNHQCVIIISNTITFNFSILNKSQNREYAQELCQIQSVKMRPEANIYSASK